MDKEPFVPKEVVEYLKDNFTTNALVDQAATLSNADQGLGFISGVLSVINHLDLLAKGEDD